MFILFLSDYFQSFKLRTVYTHEQMIMCVCVYI